MDYVELSHVVECHEDLDGKSAGQALSDTLEIVHLYEFVKVHWQHLKSQYQMLPECEAFYYLHHVFLVIRVMSLQFFK